MKTFYCIPNAIHESMEDTIEATLEVSMEKFHSLERRNSRIQSSYREN
jgi:hypothetical protein